MQERKNIKVIFDTNVWISFLIGKKLQVISDYIIDGSITIILTDQLLAEISAVTKRPKIKKYFAPAKVKELLSLLEIVALKFEIKSTHNLCRDQKDNFLLDLIDISQANFLVTGDKDLLALNPFQKTHILSPGEFADLKF